VNAADRPTRPVATFLVERYWPGVTVELFIDAVRRIDEVVARLRREGAAIRTVASTHVPDDEAAYWVVDASAVELVERVFRQAEISVDRRSTSAQWMRRGRPDPDRWARDARVGVTGTRKAIHRPTPCPRSGREGLGDEVEAESPAVRRWR